MNALKESPMTVSMFEAISMRYHWIRDRVRLNEFFIKCRPGNLNYVDFFNKHSPVHDFDHYSSIYKLPSL